MTLLEMATTLPAIEHHAGTAHESIRSPHDMNASLYEDSFYDYRLGSSGSRSPSEPEESEHTQSEADTDALLRILQNSQARSPHDMNALPKSTTGSTRDEHETKSTAEDAEAAEMHRLRLTRYPKAWQLERPHFAPASFEYISMRPGRVQARVTGPLRPDSPSAVPRTWHVEHVEDVLRKPASRVYTDSFVLDDDADLFRDADADTDSTLMAVASRLALMDISASEHGTAWRAPYTSYLADVAGPIAVNDAPDPLSAVTGAKRAEAVRFPEPMTESAFNTSHGGWMEYGSGDDGWYSQPEAEAEPSSSYSPSRAQREFMQSHSRPDNLRIKDSTSLNISVRVDDEQQ